MHVSPIRILMPKHAESMLQTTEMTLAYVMQAVKGGNGKRLQRRMRRISLTSVNRCRGLTASLMSIVSKKKKSPPLACHRRPVLAGRKGGRKERRISHADTGWAAGGTKKRWFGLANHPATATASVERRGKWEGAKGANWQHDV